MFPIKAPLLNEENYFLMRFAIKKFDWALELSLYLFLKINHKYLGILCQELDLSAYYHFPMLFYSTFSPILIPGKMVMARAG